VVPASGRSALFIGNHATHIVGWPVSEGEHFLEKLNRFATQPRCLYSHRRRDGNLATWDNRYTVHRATNYDISNHKRDLRRATINEHGPEMASTGTRRT